MNKGQEALEKLTKIHTQDEFRQCCRDINKELKEGEKAKNIAKHYAELVFTLIEELNIEFELSIDGYRDEDGQIDIDYYVSLNGYRKKVSITKEQYELLRKWEEN